MRELFVQEDLAFRLEAYVKENGTKYVLVSDKTGIDPSLLSRLKNRRMNLSDNYFRTLDEFLKGEGY